jgi:polyphosphate kinase
MERERPSPIETDAARPVGETRYFNRELTWLDFNARVIALAEDDALPVLERVKFSRSRAATSITSSRCAWRA